MRRLQSKHLRDTNGNLFRTGGCALGGAQFIIGLASKASPLNQW